MADAREYSRIYYEGKIAPGAVRIYAKAARRARWASRSQSSWAPERKANLKVLFTARMDRITELPLACPPDPSGIVAWAHIGDLHLTTAAQQNFRDLLAIVDRLNRQFSDLNFVFLPGDHAEHGDPPAYELIRCALDGLRRPWFSIIGDHDVFTRTFEPYRFAMLPATWYAFDCGSCRLIALNAFTKPAPESFRVDPVQLAFLQRELEDSAVARHRAVILLHCYPSDLKEGYEALRDLIARYRPVLVEMGHTHYNEIARDESCVYTTTRSTGQFEEGPVGFSLTTIDESCLGWRFVPLADESPVVMITSPADYRLRPNGSSPASSALRARIWSDADLLAVYGVIDTGSPVPLTQLPGARLWQTAPITGLNTAARIRVTAEFADGRQAHDEIRPADPAPAAQPAPRDQDNAIGAWPERHILGTRLGPNKNGRKW